MADGSVLDASVVINLLGCGAGERVLRALPGRHVIADVTSREIVRHPMASAGRGAPLQPLLDAGLLERVELMPAAIATFLRLVGADPPDDLGDGESAAIALAEQLGLSIALDDAKARRIVREKFSNLQLQTSVDLLALPSVAAALGEGLADAMFSALTHARMRVTAENEAWVLLLLGGRAAECPSLRKRRK
jgi:predicted nucleic acid-binding protein